MRWRKKRQLLLLLAVVDGMDSNCCVATITLKTV